MAIHKQRVEDVANGLLLEAAEAIELPPAAIDDAAVSIQFPNFQPFVPELLEVLRQGATAETVPVIKDGSTFAVHGRTRTFWIKIWHRTDSEMTAIEKVRILNCLPSMRNMRIVLPEND